MKRLFDVFLSIILIILLFWLLILIMLAVMFTSKGPALYFSSRVGVNNELFEMPKLRTMRLGTPAVATHLLDKPQNFLTPIGCFLRRSSLDELPQLFCILKGDMSFVGPRPALFNQTDLIALRTKCRVHSLRPGLTGLAQINGRDELSIYEKVALDQAYLHKQSIWFDFSIIIKTIEKVLLRNNVHH